MKERNNNHGCLKGCGCFSLGFIAGIITIPLIVYFAASNQSIRKFTMEKLKPTVIKILPQKIKNLANESKLVTLTGGKGQTERVEIFDSIIIRYHCTTPEESSTPFIYGIIKNTGNKTISKLIIEMEFFSRKQPYSEIFEIIKGHGGERSNLLPGKERRFAIHPSSAPQKWAPSKIRLKIHQIRYSK